MEHFMRDFQFRADQSLLCFIAFIRVMMRAFAFLSSAAKFISPFIAIVGMDMFLSLLLFTGEIPPYTFIAELIMNMAVIFGEFTD
jgi:hypothetical protein